MTRLLYIVTHPMTARYLLRGQLRFMRQKELEVFLICSPGKDSERAALEEGVPLIPVRIEREVSVFRDLKTLAQIYATIRRLKPTIVNAGTPKAALLGMIASALARVPLRIYTLRGLRLETKKGWSRSLLSATERIASACAHRVICVSNSLRDKYISLGLVRVEKTIVIGAGSSNGINAARFSSFNPHQKQEIRKSLGIPGSAFVVGFVGRLTRDKGIIELLAAFDELSQRHNHLYLMIAGDVEPGDPLPFSVVQKMKEHPQIKNLGFITDPAPYYGAMDILAFPSYREGFPNVPLEAAATGVPTVAFKATGTVDAVIDGITGILVKLGDARELAAAVERYLGDETLRTKHGANARKRVMELFRQESVWNALYGEYMNLLYSSGKI